jgi:2-polyprenyl-6-methoxyphenol hydroxylase-like FAD-dependent oxidoreductase
VLTLAGDNGTWSVTVFSATGDQPLKQLRDVDTWTRVIAACPLHAHWLDGQPITDILIMAGIIDRYRRFVVDGSPVATGFVALGDAWACTNPSAGRGLTVGFLHAVELRNALREAGDDPRALVERFDARTEESVSPWYHAQIASDRARFAQMNALREGRSPEPPADDLARQIGSLMSIFGADPDLFRAGLEYVATITPVQQILSRPEVRARIEAVRQQVKGAPAMPVPGPDRQQLLGLLA